MESGERIASRHMPATRHLRYLMPIIELHRNKCVHNLWRRLACHVELTQAKHVKHVPCCGHPIAIFCRLFFGELRRELALRWNSQPRFLGILRHYFIKVGGSDIRDAWPSVVILCSLPAGSLERVEYVITGTFPRLWLTRIRIWLP